MRETNTEEPMLQPDRIVSTTCPYCGVGCTLQLHLTGDLVHDPNHGSLDEHDAHDFSRLVDRASTGLLAGRVEILTG